MSNWTKVNAGTFNGVSVTSEGAVSIPVKTANDVFGNFDRAAAYVNGTKIGLRVGSDIDTTYKIQKDHNRYVVNCAAAVRAVLGSTPDSASRLGYRVEETEHGKMLVVDLADLRDDNDEEANE